ncbi:uncharacterized protein LY89DRAFT_662511 [Mollisia scopiformis]|uniref:Uncharacterized protein n=1 Tax=Mollisia scopiformis TaxID=149040 RepID=A0A194XTQ5_MOLSC|nr:uncharacterized protein LY89DRAFT_662511 [Mollisia scopiformis]KUJ23700.1 hypothetical protein LY89DRAFT_662511 [Mollisia scopiformis]
MQQKEGAEEKERSGGTKDESHWGEQSASQRLAIKAPSDSSNLPNPYSTKWYIDEIIAAIRPKRAEESFRSIQRLETYVDAAEQHEELATAFFNEAERRRIQYCKSIQAIIQCLCQHAHVLRRSKREFFGPFRLPQTTTSNSDKTTDSARATKPATKLEESKLESYMAGEKALLERISEALRKLYTAATELFNLPSAGVPRDPDAP